ncbi:tetratricopeptide repeat protein [Flexivirga sp. B27]
MARETPHPVASDPPPGPGPIDGLDSLTAALRELRVWAGSPSYTWIAREVGVIRGRRGAARVGAAPGRVTVYDCFRDGRQRIDTDLVVDIAEALGAGIEGRTLWRLAARSAMRPAGRITSQVAALPQRTRPFAGRAEELARLTAPDAPRVHVLHGLSGVGKSALAVTAAHELLEAGLVDTAVRVVLGSGEGDLDPFDAIVSVLRTLDPHGTVPSTPAGRRAAYLRLLSSRSTALVLDDVDRPEDVELLLPIDSTTRVLITSRWVLEWPIGVEDIELDGLDAASCARLLSLTAGRRLAVDDQAAVDLQQASDGLPLAVSLIGARAARQTTWTAGQHVQAYRDRLTSLQLEDGVAGALTITYDGLRDDERRALRLLSLHPALETGLGAAAALLGRSTGATYTVLVALERSHLLRRTAENRWEMHSLVQVFGQRAALHEELTEDRAAASRRVLDFYCAKCASAIIVPNPSAAGDLSWLPEAPARWGAEDAVHWLETERTTLLAAADQAFGQGHHTHFLRLATMLSWHLWNRGDMNTAMSLQRVAASTAAVLGDSVAEATAERHLGMTYVRSSRPAQARAHLERAVALLRDDRHGHLPAALNSLAVCSLITGDYEQAIRELDQVNELAVGAGDADLRSRALANLGVAHTRLGHMDEAVAALEGAARLAAEHHWPDRERISLSNLADIFAQSDDPQVLHRAVRTAEAAITQAQSFGDEIGVLYSRSNLAIALHRLGDTAQAFALTHRVREQAERLEVPELLASVLNNLAQMHQRDGRPDQARSWFRRALEVARARDAAFEVERAEHGLAALGGDAHATVVSTTRGSSEGPG